MKAKKLIITIAVAVILIVSFGTALQWQRSGSKSDEEGSGLALNEKAWTAISCRMGLYLQKVQGKVAELTWSELWWLSSHRGIGFSCAEGRAGLRFSSIDSAEDHRE